MNCVKKKSASQKRIYIFKTKKLGHILFAKNLCHLCCRHPSVLITAGDFNALGKHFTQPLRFLSSSSVSLEFRMSEKRLKNFCKRAVFFV